MNRHPAPLGHWLFALTCATLFCLQFERARAAGVRIETLPDAGVQPAVAVGRDGTVHLVYLVGDPKAADVLYRRRSTGQTAWSASVRVNSQAGSAIAIGTIRGPQCTIGHGGRVHVVWNGSSTAEPKPPLGGAPLLYARLSDDGTAFSRQRNLMTITHALDGGGSIAGDGAGRVSVAWHGSLAGNRPETERVVVVSESTDDGVTFAAERIVSPNGLGACGCCGLTVLTGTSGTTWLMVRSASSMSQRDMTVLISEGPAVPFREVGRYPWAVSQCPMSSASGVASGDRVYGAWETAGRIWVAPFAGVKWREMPKVMEPQRGAKHPRLAVNARGEMLVVWTEGTGWQRGGSMAWRLLDPQGEPLPVNGQEKGVRIWSYPAVYADDRGDFVLLR